jgi:hypothetical protein
MRVGSVIKTKEVAVLDDLRKKIAQFSEIAKSCPENLQEKCFEILLCHHLGTLARPETNKTSVATDKKKEDAGAEEPPPEEKDITVKDLNLKGHHILTKYSISLEEINQLFYKKGDQFLPLYDDLKTKMTSESQIRIALLEALKKGMATGEFSFNGEEVRKECEMRKCYDPANFAHHFKNNAQLFEKFKRYKKATPEIKLSADGQKALAELIKELQ